MPRVHYRLVDSTNERGKALGAAGAPHGTTVTASEQTAGRGRQGRAWSAPPGTGLLVSTLLRDLGPRDALLPLAAAVAVCEACEGAAPVACEIKWPNDVWIERRKVSGILVEGRPQEGWAVVGVGINVSTAEAELPPDLRGTATSLRLAGAAQVDLEHLLGVFVARLAARLSDDADDVLSAWRARDALRGVRVRWGDGEGQAAGIDDAGSLLVDTSRGRVALDAGEVHLADASRPS